MLQIGFCMWDLKIKHVKIFFSIPKELAVRSQGKNMTFVETCAQLISASYQLNNPGQVSFHSESVFLTNKIEANENNLKRMVKMKWDKASEEHYKYK